MFPIFKKTVKTAKMLFLYVCTVCMAACKHTSFNDRHNVVQNLIMWTLSFLFSYLKGQQDQLDQGVQL